MTDSNTCRMWSKKYEPASLDEIVGHDDIIERLESFSRTQSFPNLLISGPTGVGKTVSAKCFANRLHGEYPDESVLYIDDSLNGRGMPIQDRASQFIRADSRSHIPKIVIIEHGETLVDYQQDALRALLQRYQQSARVIITCRNSSEINQDLQSLCAVFRFEPVKIDEMVGYIKSVCNEEDIRIEPAAIDRIHNTADGDVRKATNMLQAVASEKQGRVQLEDVTSLLSHFPSETMSKMISEAISGDYDNAVEKLNLITSSGVSGEEIISEIYDIIHDIDIEGELRTKITDKIGEAEYRIQSGGDMSIQISSLLAEIALMAEPDETQ